MKKLIGGFGLLLLAWGLGWVSHQQWNAEPDIVVSMRAPLLPPPALRNKSNSTASTNEDHLPADHTLAVILRLLEQKQFQAALEHFEVLQTNANDTLVLQARELFLSHARRLIHAQDFRLAKQLLKFYLQNSFRDVEALLLMSEIDLAENNFQSAINRLYEAKGYAYRPEMIDQTRERIRQVVDRQTRLLQQRKNHVELLELYQYLTQLEPDYAPYFLRLATAQLALSDTRSARRSLHLIEQDPDVGLQAQAMLKQPPLAEPAQAEPTTQMETADIPLSRVGDHFLVDAWLNNSTQVRLLIDTGASMTILSPGMLERNNIAYRDTGKTRLFNTANGQVSAPIYEIGSLSLGEWQVSPIKIAAMPIDHTTAFHGLLGMNYLKHFQFFIDQNEARLRLQGNHK